MKKTKKILTALTLALIMTFITACGNGCQDREPHFDPTVSAMISTGGGHSMIVDNQGRVWTWGYNSRGQLGHGEAGNDAFGFRPRIVEGLYGIIAVSSGLDHSMALDEYGKVWTWGGGGSGQLGHSYEDYAWDIPWYIYETRPRMVEGLSGIATISAGAYHNLALDNQGRLWTWGLERDANGWQISIAPRKLTQVYACEDGNEFTDAPTFKSISSGYYGRAALDIYGRIWMWGRGWEFVPWEMHPRKVIEGHEGVRLPAFSQVSISGRLSLFLDIYGNMWSSGLMAHSGHGGEPDEYQSLIRRLEGLPKIRSISAGAQSSLAVDILGNLWTWGACSFGSFGDWGTFVPTPRKIEGGPANVQAVSLSQGLGSVLFNAAIDGQGRVWTWGFGRFLGQGDQYEQFDVIGFPRRIESLDCLIVRR